MWACLYQICTSRYFLTITWRNKSIWLCRSINVVLLIFFCFGCMLCSRTHPCIILQKLYLFWFEVFTLKMWPNFNVSSLSRCSPTKLSLVLVQVNCCIHCFSSLTLRGFLQSCHRSLGVCHSWCSLNWFVRFWHTVCLLLPHKLFISLVTD